MINEELPSGVLENLVNNEQVSIYLYIPIWFNVIDDQ